MGREAGIEGQGSGERGGGKRGLDTPLSTPTLKLMWQRYHLLFHYSATNYTFCFKMKYYNDEKLPLKH